MYRLRVIQWLAVVAASLAAAAFPLSAPATTGGEVVVNIGGIASATGQIGCALFPAGAGFPMDNTGARQVWIPAESAGVTCRFADVPEGRWAVSVSHDLNGNRKVDTNFFGIPSEAWGVSNNIRPTMRAPRFEEASFSVTSGQPMTIDIRVAK